MVTGMVDVQLDDELEITYREGEERTLEVVVTYDAEEVVTYETNSRPWDEGIVQIRNVIAMNLDEGYSREEILDLLEDSIPERESELRALFD